MLGIFGSQKCALVMIEPPGHARISRVLKINDGVLVTVEQSRFEQLRGLVRQSGIGELRGWVELSFNKAAEERSRRRSVEAMIVIKDSHPHFKNNDPGK